MRKILILSFAFIILASSLSSCGKKSNPVLRDENGKVIEGNSFPPPYDSQITQ